MSVDLEELKDSYKEILSVEFFIRDELIGLKISNQSAVAEIFLQGAHLTQYGKKAEQAIIWCSKNAKYQKGRAIRGGIPLCWPWFGNLDKNKTIVQTSMLGQPNTAHGFVRTADWTLVDIYEPSLNETTVRFELRSDENSRKVFPYGFKLVIEFTIGDELNIRWTVTNTSEAPFTYSSAMHTYYSVKDISQTSVLGFEQLDYINALDQWTIDKQEGGIVFNQEVDRIYLETPDECIIQCLAQKSSIKIKTKGSRSAIVWNPWIEKSKALSDYADDEYTQMVCVETANANDDYVTLNAGQSHHLCLSISSS